MALTKADLIEACEKQGIKLTGDETVADLKKLIADNAEQVTDPAAVAELQKDPAAQEAIAEANAVIVRDPHGHPHRTYSLEMHGENFRKLAEQYISVRPGWSLK